MPRPSTRTKPEVGRTRGWRRRLLVGGIVSLAVAMLGTGVWLLGFSTVLDVRTITVQRPAKALLSERQVLRLAQIPTGQPVARVDLQAVADRVASLPEVAEVTVTRSFPHSVTVDVTERTAAYAIKADGGYRLVDVSGISYHQVETVPRGLVAVTAAGADRALLTGLADVVGALPKQVRDDLTRIEAPTRDQVTLILRDGVRVIWGSPEDSQLKGEVAVVLLAVKGVRTVDVSAPSHPTTR